jgi:hypothetical protein
MRLKHAELVALGVGHKDGPTWKSVAAAAAKAGQVNRKGGPPSEGTIRQVWSRVCRDVAADEAQTAQARAAMFPTLRPFPAQQPQPVQKADAPPTAASHSRQHTASPTSEDPDPPGGSLAALWRDIEKRSGR